MKQNLWHIHIYCVQNPDLHSHWKSYYTSKQKNSIVIKRKLYQKNVRFVLSTVVLKFLPLKSELQQLGQM